MRLMPRRSIHSTSGLNVPAKTSATTSSSTTDRSWRKSHTPPTAARIQAIERGVTSTRTTVGACMEILVPALAAGITRSPTMFIVRSMAVVRVAGVTALRPVANALVAFVLVVFTVIVVAVTTAANAATPHDCSACERHVTNASGAGPGIPVQGATGKRDGRAGQD